ncbi:hypothetical protein BWQ96_01155 [Gracilariopsis chorda]|uniref:Pentatricopeptide repeat-containing protein n=1 Tax=Gracilariopsis chorda TaxID=448386 RepID=A0A2V3J4U2_9FLOR|nr:hypothetical protein BWQ96_01155 [Gracilariopsis chorda]|eukprot:PXF49017.1 hypothetical protein BWQ96_01155 [Gracilariopsis chorda]
MYRAGYPVYRTGLRFDSLSPCRILSKDWRRQSTFSQFQSHYLATSGGDVPSLAKVISTERVRATDAPQVSIPNTPIRSKKSHSVRASDLYTALVYEEESRHHAKLWVEAMAVTQDGSRISEVEDADYRKRLERNDSQQIPRDPLGVISDITRKGYTPSARAFIMAIEACIATEQYESAEHALSILDALPRDHATRTPRLVCIAKTLLAFSYTSTGLYEEALRVMGFPNKPFARGDKQLTEILNSIGLGRDTLAWGVLVKSLTKLGSAETAIAVVDVSMRQGVGMTDSLLHLTIDSLRKLHRWREADWLFTTAVEKGVKPSEITLGSILLTLTGKSARRVVDRARVEEIVDMAKHPSPKFMKVALMALTSVGLMERAEALFYEVGHHQEDGVLNEDIFGYLMTGYGNYLQLLTVEEIDHVTVNRKYEEINKKADLLWEMHVQHYGHQVARRSKREAKNMLLRNYIRVKTRCFKAKEAVDILEQVVLNREKYPMLEVSTGHICTVLGAVELSCDVEQLTRLMHIMQVANINHDMRSLAFSIGTHIGDGNLTAALELVKEHLAEVMKRETISMQFRQHHPILLARRLETLRNGLRDAGIGNVEYLEDAVRSLRRKNVVP